MTLEEILNKNEEFRYKLLSRMKADCEYYLDAGQHQIKHLWAGNVDDQIHYMKEIYFSLPRYKRQDVLGFSLATINALSKQMDHRPVLELKDIGDVREDGLKKTYKSVYFSIEQKNRPHLHGVMEITPKMEKYFRTLIQDRPYAFSVNFIEWDDSWNMILRDGLWISDKYLRVEKRDFAEWKRNNLSKMKEGWN